MSLLITLIYDLESDDEEVVKFQIPLKDDTPSSFNRIKEQVKTATWHSRSLDIIILKIGSRMYENENIENQRKELILSRLMTALEYIKANSTLSSKFFLSVQINHSTFPIISPLLNWMKDIKEIKELEIESVQPFSEDQYALFMQVICEKLTYLKTLSYDIVQTKNSTNCIQKSLQYKNESIEDITFNSIKSIEDIFILSSFSNLLTLKLLFPIISSETFIDQTLIKASELVPSIKTLELKVDNNSPYSLSQIRSFSSLQSIKIEAKSSLEIDLSKLKELTSIHIESPDPLTLFCKQKKLENLQSLSLFNIEGIVKVDEIKNEIEQYQQAILEHTHLNSLIFQSTGNNQKTQNFIKRDLEVFSAVIKQLKIFNVTLVPSKYDIRKEIDENLVTILCQLLDKCQQEVRINYNFETTYISNKSKCDLGLSVRRLSDQIIFSLNGGTQEMIESIDSSNNIIEIGMKGFQNYQDNTIFLIILGSLTPQYFLNTTLSFSNEQIAALREYSNNKDKDKDTIEKIRQILFPYKRINVKKFYLPDSLYFSRDLLSIRIGDQINLKVISSLIDAYPKLIQIFGHCNQIKNLISSDTSYFPKRIIELNLNLKQYSYETLIQIIKIKGHFIKCHSNINFQFPQIEAIQIIELISKSNQVTFSKPEYSDYKTGYIQLSDYCDLIEYQQVKATAFYLIIAGLLPINPLMVYFDLYF